MRSLGSAILIIIALLLAAVGGPALWAERNVVDQAGFVELAGPLGENAAFQEGLSAVIGSQSAAQLDLPGPLQNLAASLISTAAGAVYSQPGYTEAWSETLSRSHALTFATDAAGTATGELSLDVAPLVALVAGQLTTQTGVALAVPETVPVSFAQPTLTQALPWVTTLAGIGQWLLGAAVVLFLLALVIAKHKGRTFVLAGVGLALVALAWFAGASAVSGLAGTLGSGDDIAVQFGRELSLAAQESWGWGIRAGFIAAAALGALGVLSRIVRRRPTP